MEWIQTQESLKQFHSKWKIKYIMCIYGSRNRSDGRCYRKMYFIKTLIIWTLQNQPLDMVSWGYIRDPALKQCIV